MFRNKFLKISVLSLASLATVVALTATGVYLSSNHRLQHRFAFQVATVAVPANSEAIERGRHIVTTRACVDCHGTDFAGRKVIDDPMAGVLWGPNITHGSGGLPTDYSELDYVRAIREGVTRDGRPLVLMPSIEYSAMSDEDLGAVIAYLKTIPAVDRARGPVALGPVLRAMLVLGQIKLAAEEIDHTAAHPVSVQAGITPAYGKYLATSCTGCHGPNLSGGKIAGAPPDWPPAANLTPHSSGRLSQWSEEQFITTLRTKTRPDGTAVNPIMPAAIGEMSDQELKALWTYLRTVPPAQTGSRSEQAQAEGNGRG